MLISFIQQIEIKLLKINRSQGENLMKVFYIISHDTRSLQQTAAHAEPA